MTDYSIQVAQLADAARQLASMQPWRPPQPTTTTTRNSTLVNAQKTSERKRSPQ
jgi:hypothetical protein